MNHSSNVCFKAITSSRGEVKTCIEKLNDCKTDIETNLECRVRIITLVPKDSFNLGVFYQLETK
jgi:hypothetical protein